MKRIQSWQLWAAVALGGLPIGYGFMFGIAREKNAITESFFTVTFSLYKLMTAPGRVFLAVTPYDFPFEHTESIATFQVDVVASFIANCIGWFTILVLVLAFTKWLRRQVSPVGDVG